MKTQKTIKTLVKSSLIFLLLGGMSLNFAHAQEDIRSGFNPERIIEDSVFSDTKTFSGPEGIQKFLENKKSVLANTTPEFIALLREPDVKEVKDTVEDPHSNLDKKRTAAELIWDASQSSGLNPQVLLVKFNKEQSFDYWTAKFLTRTT